MKRWICVISSIVLMTQLCRSVCTADDSLPPKESDLHALSACMMDGDSGRVLYGKNENEELAMASTTKIMTCILIMENCDPDEVVTASQNAADQPKVHLGVRKGQRFLLEDLLFALMLESYNDAAVMLAEHLDGSVEAFADRMNRKAKSLYCLHTHFVTPNGLDGTDEGGEHHTTATDLARIMRYCVMESEKSGYFMKVTQTSSHSFSDLDQQSAYSCSNHNQLLSMTDGVLSGKTGFTGKAGYCYVCAVRNKGRTYIITLLGCGWPNNKTYKWKDTVKLLEYGKEVFDFRKPVSLGIQDTILVKQPIYPWGESGKLQHIRAEETTGQLKGALMTGKEEIRVVYSYKKTLTAPVQAGTEIGKVSYMLDGICLGTDAVIVAQDISEISLQWCARVLFHHFLWKNNAA